MSKPIHDTFGKSKELHMPRLTERLPRIRKHPNGQAIVSVDGEIYYLGKFGSKVSKVKYDRLMAEWLAGNRTLPPKQPQKSASEKCPAGGTITVDDVLLRFVRHAKATFKKNGEHTEEFGRVKRIARTVSDLYGDLPAEKFGPVALRAVQQRLVEKGWARKTVNDHVQRIVRAFKHAASWEMIPGSVVQNLKTVEGLRKGRTEAHDNAPVQPVAMDIVEKTLPHLPTIVADMVRLQLLTGMRPTEVCILRPCDVNRTNDVWIYVPYTHKTEHHEKQRRVYLGPQAQEVLSRYLLRPAESYCFDPRESRKAYHDRRERKTPLNQGNRKGYSKLTRAGKRPKRQPKEHYTRDSYRRAIHRACEKSCIEKWAPNQLRHNKATSVRQEFGLEATQVTLGHASAAITEVYTARDERLAIEVARQTG